MVLPRLITDLTNDYKRKVEVYRNTHNLCVVCGEPMTTTVFFDVPVCSRHPKGSEEMINIPSEIPND